jgi:dTDP-4-amino-4,6-dideoxygalactose transaminase
MIDFKPLFDFEKKLASFFGSPFAVCVDCCTHGLELSLYLSPYKKAICPKKTYVSVPFMLEKIKFDYEFISVDWKNFYYLTPDVIDAAAFWKRNSYVKGKKMCVSFHFKKHINIGRGGVILLDNEFEYDRLLKMRYDGRSIYDGVPYDEENIQDIGYHYYMTPENAKIGLEIFEQKKDIPAKPNGSFNYSDVTDFDFFKKLTNQPNYDKF